MRIGIYNQYLNSLGGGERYTSSLAAYWSNYHDVTIFWDDTGILNQISTRFNLNMQKVKIRTNIFTDHFLRKLYETNEYDLIFMLTDGSIPATLAHHNIIHFQVPFNPIRCPIYKRNKFDSVVCNSQFTRDNLDPVFAANAVVIYPPVAIDNFKVKPKQKIILSVGRFSSHFAVKKQEVLIDAFKAGLRCGTLKEFKLILVGGLMEDDRDYFEKLKLISAKYPIELIPNCSFVKLKSLYSSALFYWHAAGFSEVDPRNMEHFGISTVEAMASGCISLVFNGGGQREIINNGINGCLWDSLDELITKTEELTRDKIRQKYISEQAQIRAQNFSERKFYQAYDSLLEKIIK
jgi:O-antigen biosynthesis protein